MIVGHQHIVDLLRLAVSRGRVPQSLLFAGPEGVGKHAMAIALAQAVNCARRTDGWGCGGCPTCKRIAAGTHSDVVVLDEGDEASIKIRALRERVLDVVGYRPFEAARRVFIIDPADLLGDEAQDALLKTLEEPPSSVLIVLVSAHPDTLRPTIQSRCRRLRFGLLTEEDVVRVLVERERMPEAHARVLAAASGGSVARALASEDSAAEADRDAALQLLAASRAGQIGPRLRAADALAKNRVKGRARQELDARLVALASLTRDMAVVASGAAVPLANADLETPIGQIAASLGPDRLDAAYAAIVSARHALDRNASPKIVADWLAVRL